jgi:hypothetical protein
MINPEAINPQRSAMRQPGGKDLTQKGRRSARERKANGKSWNPFRSPVFLKIPGELWVVCLLITAWSIFTPNPALTICSIWMLPLLTGLLFFPGEPPVLLFATVMQWLQATAGIFYCNIKNLPINSPWTSYGVADFELATWLSLAGVLALAVGMRVALRNRNMLFLSRLPAETRSLKVNKLFSWYLASFLIFAVFEKIAASFPSFSQPILTMATLRWVLIYLLAQTVLKTKRNYTLLLVVVGLELVKGCLGFFGGFKSIMFVLLVAVLGSELRIRTQQKLVCAALAAVALFLGVVWSSIKPEYREALNQGSGEQEVTIPVAARLEKLVELVGNLTSSDLADGFDTMLKRYSYVEFFAHSMENVPSVIPYEHGRLWWGAIKHVLMPRLFFPNKPALNDSEITNKYTLLNVANEDQGTSIGIGYYGESYIDFGPVGMFFPIFLVGVFQGWLYRFFVEYSQKKTLGLAVATAILLFGGYLIEINNAKLLGSNVTSLLVMACFVKFLGKPFWSLISEERQFKPAQKMARSS